MKNALLKIAVICVSSLFAVQAQAISLVPGGASDTGNDTDEAVVNAYVESTYGVSKLYGASNASGPVTEDGAFASSYETEFDNLDFNYQPGDDASLAFMSYIGGASIDCPACYVLVQGSGVDIAANPAWYLFDIGSWDGLDYIDVGAIGDAFWTDAAGSMVSVAIYGEVASTPEPQVLLLLSMGLIGLFFSRRKAA